MSDFHFISPQWFLALLPLGLLLWAALRADTGASAWRRVIHPQLLAVLRVGGEQERLRYWPLVLLAGGWLITVVALANPTFERKPVPAFRTDAARVVVLDLSRSMLAEDLTPSRLERARYKVADILSRSADGQVGLVAFAGDAFAVSPLTDDAETIRGMLDALSPQIMPLPGSRPDLGIERGLELLAQAGARQGEVLLLTDDDGGVRATRAAEQVRASGHRLAVIGVGTEAGAPVPGISRTDGPVMTKLPVDKLQALARAGGGAYARLSSSDADLNLVLRPAGQQQRAVSETDPMLAERWYELGPWVALLLLPIGALAFRRGWLMVWALLALGVGPMITPKPAYAFGWADLWQRPDQQAAQALANGELERARELAQEPARAGTAAYRLGDYQDAAQRFAQGGAAVDHYNRGNALARGGQLEEALAAYDEALAQQPDFADAQHNRAQVEAALRAQQQEQQQQQGNEGQRQEEGQAADQDAAQDGEQSSEQSEAQAQQREQAASSPSDGSSEDAGDASQHQDDAPGEQAAEQQAQGQQPGQSDEQGDEQASGEGADQRTDRRPGQPGAQAGDPLDPSTGTASEDGRQEADADADFHGAGAEEDAAAKAAEDYRDEVAAAQSEASRSSSGDAQTDAEPGSSADLTPEDREARQAADQWLRRIPDDPAELLRRKFLYQYQARQDDARALSIDKPW